MQKATINAAIEHVNISVADLDASIALLSDLFGWRVRWRGEDMAGGETAHLGSDDHYLALYQPAKGDEPPSEGFQKGLPLNHVGIVVDDLDAAEQRVIAHGLTPFSHGDYEPGRRFYFFDPNHIEFEVISYSR